MKIWYLWLLIIGLATVNIFLLRQNAQLRDQAEIRKPPALQIGETVQPFSGIGLSGERIEIDYSNNSKKRLFLYFAPSCKYCGQQFPDWKEMLKQISSDQIEVFGIVSENEKQSEVDNYLHSFDCDSDSATPLRVIFASTETLQNYKLNVTPTSLLISPNGKSEKVWTGKWNNNEKENAFALIKQ